MINKISIAAIPSVFLLGVLSSSIIECSPTARTTGRPQDLPTGSRELDLKKCKAAVHFSQSRWVVTAIRAFGLSRVQVDELRITEEMRLREIDENIQTAPDYSKHLSAHLVPKANLSGVWSTNSQIQISLFLKNLGGNCYDIILLESSSISPWITHVIGSFRNGVIRLSRRLIDNLNAVPYDRVYLIKLHGAPRLVTPGVAKDWLRNKHKPTVKGLIARDEMYYRVVRQPARGTRKPDLGRRPATGAGSEGSR